MFHNDVEKATLPTRFQDFEYCISKDDVDIENDTFKFLAGGTDGVCIFSLHVDNKQIFVGKNDDLTSFEFDQPDQWKSPFCLENRLVTSSLSIKNGEVIESQCKKS